MAKKRGKKAAKPKVRRVWTRKPTQRPHSTKKGAKGCTRSDAKRNKADQQEPDEPD